MKASPSPLLPRRLRPVIQIAGFLRKELMDVLRQPRLLLVLVAGPFLILLAFAAGYDQESVRLRTTFVGPEGSIYETAIESYQDEVARYVETAGYTSDLLDARRDLTEGRTDLVVVFPSDPASSVLEGEQATIRVLHDKLDPLQQTAVEISAQIAVAELNASILETLVGEAQEALRPMEESLALTGQLVAELQAAAAEADEDRVADTSRELRSALRSVEVLATVSDQAVAELRGGRDDGQREQLAQLRSTVREMEAALGSVESARTDSDRRAAVERVASASDELAPRAGEVLSLDPRVVTRPFVADTENLLQVRTRVNDFFAPSALSLLLQHLAITFAALTLVRDQSLGLFEIFRVGPVAARHVLAGKYLAYLLIGGVVAAALVASVKFGLDVPLRGSVAWLVLGVGLLLVASIGFGLLLSTVARSDSQAIQFAMLTLLAGLFFGGFFLSLDAFDYPVKAVSWALPVTYAISLLQDVMLRGTDPAVFDVAGLATLAVVYGGAATLLFSRRLAVR